MVWSRLTHTKTMKNTYQAKQERKAVKWAARKLRELLAQTVKQGPDKGQKMWPVQSARNQVLIEAQREFNIGCAKAIEKALNIRRVDETEEEIAAWETGLDTPEEKQADTNTNEVSKFARRQKTVRLPLKRLASSW